MSATNCDLCDELSGRAGSKFDRIYGHDPKSRILFRSEQFVVIPSLGQVLEGYLLIIPTTHLAALGDMSDGPLNEFTELCSSVRGMFEAEYGSCIFFEHGTRCEGVGGCGVYHAHLHAVPFPEALEPLEFLVSEFPHSEFADLREVREESKGLTSYLFYQNSRGRSYLFRTGVLPSQYMRKLLAERLGSKDWDWRTAGREERLLATLTRLSGRFHALAVNEVTNAAGR